MTKTTKSLEVSAQKRTQIAKKNMLEALEKSMGIASHACKTAGIARRSHYEWMADDPDYRAAVEELDGVTLDFAESKLMANINNGSDTAIIFFLKTRGKKRGYIERTEVVNSGEISFKPMTDAQVEKVLRELRNSKK